MMMVFIQRIVSNVASKQAKRELSVLGQALPPLLGSRQRQTELLARLAALSEMHAPQEQQQDLNRQQERLQLEGLLAESTAKLAVRPLRFKVLLKHPQIR